MRALVIVYSNCSKLLVVNYLPMQNLLSDAEKLFPHAEAREYGAEDFVGGDFADDFGEVVETEAEVFADEVAGEAGCEGGMDAADGVEGLCEGFGVAEVGDYDVGVADFGETGGVEEHVLKGGDVVYLTAYPGEFTVFFKSIDKNRDILYKLLLKEKFDRLSD